MRAEELGEELADFWFSAMASADWDERYRLLKEILTQLRADIDDGNQFEAVSRSFVSALIRRVGEASVESAAQARFYALSGSTRHRDAAMTRAQAEGWQLDVAVLPSPSSERRRFPRRTTNVIGELWISGKAAPCRVTDLSEGGARVLVPEPSPGPGAVVLLAIPDAGMRDATVVFRGSSGLGLRFADGGAELGGTGPLASA